MSSSSTPSSRSTARYVVRSSDVISDMRVNVLEEGTERILWYKERFLSDEEIIENIFDHTSNQIAWTVHRPKRGWYLRVRSPAFPPGTHIALRALPRTDPNYIDGALCFGCQTALPPSPARPSISREDSVTTTHSYPPTPPAVLRTLEETSPPSASRARLSQLSTSASTSTIALAASSSTTLVSSPPPPPPPPGPRTPQITQFLLSPHTVMAEVAKSHTGLLSRAFAALRNAQPATTYSFTLTTLPSSGNPSSASPIPVSNAGHHEHGLHLPGRTHTAPLLAFHDHTGAFHVASTTGVIELDTATAQALGVHPSFWITVALAYLEYLEDREAYIAAAEG